jgi:DNA polymerase-4
MEILGDYTPYLEPISIDEAFLDVTASRALFGDGEAIAHQIKNAVRDEVRLTASVGVATTKLVAKVASELRKPDGLVVVPPGEEATFLAPLPISRLWGVGEKTAASLLDFGVRTIGDLAGLDPEVLGRRFGRHGAALVSRAHGIDPDPVATGEPAKSIGHEHTFDVDTSDREVVERTLLGMADGVAWRLRASGIKAVTITIKLRDSSFTTITRQVSLEVPADLTEPIYEAALTLLRKELHGQRIRLVGVTASNFRDRDQLALFGGEDPKRHQAAEALDKIRRKYGDRAVTRARLVKAALPAPFERDPMTPVEHRQGLRRSVPEPEDRDSQDVTEAPDDLDTDA